MSRVLVFQHAGHCGLGRIGAYLACDGIKPTIIALNEGMEIPPLEDFDILIVLGGPQYIWEEDKFPWLRQEKTAICRWVSQLEKPYLGICLGHQLLAAALGGKVARCPEPQVILRDVYLNLAARQTKLFDGFGTSTLALQWHGAEVTELPHHGRALASTRGCLVAAMAVGRVAFGIQFHIEATEESVRAWSITPPSSNLVEYFPSPDYAQGLMFQMAFASERLKASSRLFYDNFMGIARLRAPRKMRGT